MTLVGGGLWLMRRRLRRSVRKCESGAAGEMDNHE